MDVDTPVANTSAARAATSVPRNGPAPAPRTVVATAPAAAPATTPATAPATTPVPVPVTAPAAVSAPASRGGTRPPPITSRTSEIRQIRPHHTLLHRSAAREVNRLPIQRGRIPRSQSATRGASHRRGTSFRHRQPGPPPRRSTGLSSVVATLQQLQRRLG
ncbi:cyclin-dependent kinase inhibitor 1C-like [Bactrocera tryoni]|uniref:cyclin-dependent kinase inhibitor 1C-like n=1 Tax=Bactrocera tryoni TaxID=59916 RepID=UPI001A96BAB0|nr:cyclin-dependent kinase inhibitor 1C-like [Bactrocera tryoni]